MKEIEKNNEAYKALSLVSKRMSFLEAENDRLRKLVLEIWRSCRVYEDDCAKCSHRLTDDEVWCDIPILMQELGVIE